MCSLDGLTPLKMSRLFRCLWSRLSSTSSVVCLRILKSSSMPVEGVRLFALHHDLDSEVVAVHGFAFAAVVFYLVRGGKLPLHVQAVMACHI